MHNFKKDCLGTRLHITINDKLVYPQDIDEIFKIVDTFEKKYSRFEHGNFLKKLNTEKKATLDTELLSLIKLSLKVSEMTSGYFDITLLPLLENIGYGIEKEKMEEKIGYKNISFHNNEIQLHNGVTIELGSVGKGYMVDTIYNMLERKYSEFSINFGGDIKIKGEQKIFLEDPLDDSKIIGEVLLEDASIASSNPRKRQTKKGSHLVNPIKGKKIDQKKVVFTTHILSSFSDVFSTALYVSPLDVSLDILEKTRGLEGLIIAENGEIYQSKGFPAILYK